MCVCVCVCAWTYNKWSHPRDPGRPGFVAGADKLQSSVTADTPPFELSEEIQADKHFKRLGFHFVLFPS